jgi:hypothetical protein
VKNSRELVPVVAIATKLGSKSWLNIKKLLDRGVLEEDEYRRIRTLNDPFPKDAENIPKTLPVISKRAAGEDRRI